MKIKVKMQFVEGEFDTITDNLVAVPYHKHGVPNAIYAKLFQETMEDNRDEE